jgi:exonuclease SbcC
MCYRGEATLDLTGIHLACLAGENGHGKSALLDALTYALWGKTRAQREDDLITLNADEMEVEMEFLLGPERYRILRKRSKRGKTRQTALELQIWDGEQFIAQGGASARETQARITAVLRMSYETFINSAFLLQGHADEFARKPPAERKQILGDILGLMLYDDYEERARLRVKQLEEDSQRVEGEILAIQSELRQKPQREAELVRVEREFETADSQLQAGEAALQKLRDEKRELDLKAKQAEEVERRIASTRREVHQLDAEAAQKQQTIDIYATRVLDAARIEQGYAQWQEARARNEALNTLLGKSVKLRDEQNRLEQTVQSARQSLEHELNTTRERMAALDLQVLEAAASAPEMERTRQSLAQLAEKEAQREAQREQRELLNTQAIELKATNTALRAHMDALKDRLNMLQKAEATCPVCRQPIAPAEAARLAVDFQSEGKSAADTYRANGERINALIYQAEQFKSSMQKLEQELRARSALQTYEARLAERLQRAEAAQVEREALDVQAAIVEKRLTDADYEHKAQARLAALHAELAALGYSADEHASLRRRQSELASYEDEYSQLQAARARLDAEREVLRHLSANLEKARQLIAADEAQAQALQAETARLDGVNRRVVEQQRQVNELQGRAAALNRQLGAARQWVEHAKQMEETLVARQNTRADCHAERALYEELRVAFGKKGVQAMLIEAAIPEIEEEANALLRQMTDGRMSVRLETQREKVTVKKDEAAVIETLDIVISDELGPRSYEMYSGGEAFRVNFAVRIALSKLLARRAGARLQTLVIDEGFGALDTTGRERLVEAINAVQDQFEKILVVTHIDELKDMFPVRIDIVKTGGGSSIFVN